MEFVQAFLEEPGSCYTKKGDRSEEILFALLQEKMDVFYHTRAKLNQETLEDFLMGTGAVGVSDDCTGGEENRR